MEFIMTLIFISLSLGMFGLARKWLFESSDLSDREDD